MTNQSIVFDNSTQLSILCSAINSRPSVQLTIYDPLSNIPLPLVPSTPSLPNPVTFCDDNQNCNAVLHATLSPGFASTYNIRNISCLAYNYISPYNISNSISFKVNFTGKIYLILRFFDYNFIFKAVIIFYNLILILKAMHVLTINAKTDPPVNHLQAQ